MKKYLIPVVLLLMVLLPVLNGCSQSATEKEKQEEKIVEQEAEKAEKERMETSASSQSQDPLQQEETAELKPEVVVTKEESNDLSAEKKGESAAVQEPIQQPESTNQPTAVSGGKDQSLPLKSEEKQVESPTSQANNVETPAPTTPETTKLAESKTETVSISITGNDQGTILSTAGVELQEGDSVFDILKRIAAQKQIPLEYSGIGGAVYIEGIKNLYEFDHGPLSGWMFKLNGEFSQKSAGTVKVKDGDVIEWVYTKDLGKDVGAHNS